MRAAKYLSVSLLSFAAVLGMVRLDTSASPQAPAVAAATETVNVVHATNGQAAESTKRAVRENRQVERFYATARFAGKRYKWGESTNRVKKFQSLLKTPRSGSYDQNTWTAHKAWLTFFNAPTDHLPKPPLPAPGEVAGAGQRCPQYESIALSVGWPADQIPKLSYVMWRESRCQPTAHNPRYPDDSYGLIQLNMRAHKGWVGPIVGWDFNQLFDPYTNLRVGLQLWHMAGGWGPWRV